ncbi:unnamed protein product [Agarophyton chilense]
MTCTRCSSYFCWRCKGYLNNGCPLPGRPCICDSVMTAAAYSALTVAGVAASPLIAATVLVAAPPYLAYRVVNARRARALAAHRTNQQQQQPLCTAHHNLRHPNNPFIAPTRTILRPDQLLVNDDDLDSASFITITDPAFDHPRIAHPHRLTRQRKSKPTDTLLIEERNLRPSRSASRLSVTPVERPLAAGEVVIVPPPSTSSDPVPTVFVEACRTTRPFVLERRRGSSPLPPTMKRSVA